MYYTVYKITNIINNKIYIGCHKTSDLEDDYMGSGKILKKSIEKYGIESFNKEYLHIFDNNKDMFDMELKLVNEDFIKESSNYNLKVGGEGGFDYINENITDEQKTSRAIKGYESSLKGKVWYGQNHTEETKLLMSESQKLRANDKDYINPFSGKEHSNKTLLKMSESQKKINRSGINNPHFGKIWIYNLELKENQRINKNSIIPDGWVKGRKMKF